MCVYVGNGGAGGGIVVVVVDGGGGGGGYSGGGGIAWLIGFLSITVSALVYNLHLVSFMHSVGVLVDQSAAIYLVSI